MKDSTDLLSLMVLNPQSEKLNNLICRNSTRPAANGNNRRYQMVRRVDLNGRTSLLVSETTSSISDGVGHLCAKEAVSLVAK